MKTTRQTNPVASSKASAVSAPSKGPDIENTSAFHDQRPDAIAQRQLRDEINSIQATQATEFPIQKKENKTGLPDHLKSGVENLSGYSMDDVKVHYNSAKPAQLNAHAYAQGTDIHMAPGQEKHLPHEAWHVVQQKQGRVRPTMQLMNTQVNDDVSLEKEADVMGSRAATAQRISTETVQRRTTGHIIQRAVGFKNFNTVYLPDYLAPDGGEAKARFQTSLNTLTGRHDTLHFVSSGKFTEELTKRVEKETKDELLYKNKYSVNKEEAQKLIAKASVEQQDRSKSPEERQQISDQLGEDLDGYINLVYAKNQEVQGQFGRKDKAYLYNSDKLLEEYDSPDEYMLLQPVDMHDAPGNLPQNRVEDQSCAIQTLSDLGADVKAMWSDLQSSTNVDRWHAACYAKGLDYRNDNEYIKILMKLGYELVLNKPVRYDQVDWSALGAGEYFLGTGTEGGIGHAYGVKIDNEGDVEELYDRQDLHEDTDTVTYAFKKP